MKSLTVILPWPSPDLSPNARQHWAKHANAVKAARAEAYLQALDAISAMKLPQPASVTTSTTFHAPTKRAYDLDNLNARMKPAQDGIFSALGWNDKIITAHTSQFGETKQGGRVEYTIEWRD